LTWHITPNESTLATKSILKRGFKANAEKLAKQYRENLNIHPCAPLCAFKLAEHLQVPVFSATEFLKLSDEINLLSGTNGSDCGWSALTMLTKAGVVGNQKCRVFGNQECRVFGNKGTQKMATRMQNRCQN